MRIAALDLGTNSFHLLVVDAHPDGTFEPLAKEKEMLRLGDVVAREGRVPEPDATRAVQTVARFRTLAEAADCDEIVACATSAIREADNGGEIVDRIRADTGVEVHVITGVEEARLIFDAIRAQLVAPRRAGVLPWSVNQLRFDREERLGVHNEILAVPASGRAKLPGLDAGRADIIAAGSLFLLTAMEVFGFEDLIGGEWALREGIVLDAIRHHDAADWSDDPRAIRRASVLELCRRCNWDEVHSRQVARLAVSLFDQTSALHGLGPGDREILELGSLLHDIGAHVSTESHHKHTAYLILNGRLRGFSPEEVTLLAALGRFHRGGDPRSSKEPMTSLSPASQEKVPPLEALLRV